MRDTGQTNRSDLARRAKIGRTVLHDVLRGQGWPSRETVEALAHELKVKGPEFILARPDVRDTPLSWIGEAELALSRARRLIELTASATAQRALDAGRAVDAAREELAAGEGEGRPQQRPA